MPFRSKVALKSAEQVLGAESCVKFDFAETLPTACARSGDGANVYKTLGNACSDEHQLALATHNAVSLTGTATHGVGRGTAHLALATHNAVERGGTAGSPFRQLPFSRSPFFRSGALDPPVACSLFSSLTRSHPHPCHPKIPSPPERHQYVAATATTWRLEVERAGWR